MHETAKVANIFIGWSINSKAQNEKNVIFAPVTPLALQKLLYMANAIVLSETGRRLIEETPVIGQYDPVYESLYPTMRAYGNEPISKQISAQSSDAAEAGAKNVVRFLRPAFTKREWDVIYDVFRFFSDVGFKPQHLTLFTGGNAQDWDALKVASGGLHRPIADRDIIAQYRRVTACLDCEPDPQGLAIPDIKTPVTDTRRLG